ncbi:unnamed protein product [Anisakis simplex]|uniref:G_PROTEIN_RECEP_F1_2 domain-containing protein n=1 Tax=Anisakis simplex TaxID=6269 RepID=A0A0M3J745_ANISI|nr:unnamed protein product [Anisakis simplex]
MLLVILFSVYAIQGTVLLVTNGLLALALFKNVTLRRQYVIQLYRVIVDSMVGIALLLAGTGRLLFLFTKHSAALKSQFYCMLMPWNVISVWSVIVHFS